MPVYNTDAPSGRAAAAPASKAFGCSEARRDVGFRTVELVTLPLAESAKELAPGLPAPTGADAEGARSMAHAGGADESCQDPAEVLTVVPPPTFHAKVCPPTSNSMRS